MVRLAPILRWLIGIPLLMVGCTRKVEPPSRLSITFPPAAQKPLIAQSLTASSVSSKWQLADPTLATQINCYAVAIEASDFTNSPNICTTTSDVQLAAPQFIAGGFPAESTQTIEVPSGSNRKIYLIGFHTDDLTGCVGVNTVAAGLNTNHFSAPFILTQVALDLAPGDVTVDLKVPATLPTANKFEDCLPYAFAKSSAPLPLTVSGITPAISAPGGGGVTTLTGTGFNANTTVTIGGTACTALVVSTSNTLSCTVPAHTTGTVDVVVTRGLETQNLASAFVYANLPTITIADASVGESASTAILTVTLSSIAAANVTFDYSTTSGSANAGLDFTTASGTATITAGQTTTTIAVPIIDDAVYEANETFNVLLSNLSANAVFADSSGLVTILDNDTMPTIQFSASGQTVGEGVGNASVAVSLSAASGQSTTVNYTLSGTAAGSGVDYTLANGTTTLTAGTTTANITVPIVNDALLEPPETIVLTLSTPTGATLGGTLVHTITLNDDEGPTATLSATPSDPSNLTTLAIDVGGAEVAYYKYGIQNGTNCSGVTYGSFVAETLNITDDISGLADGSVTVCVLGKSTSAVIQASPTSFTWTRDTTAPVASLTSTPAPLTNVSAISVDVGGAGLVTYQYKISSTNDCSISSGYSADIAEATNIGTSVGDGLHYLCVVGKDAIGNQQPYASATFISWTTDTLAPLMPTALTLLTPGASPGNIAAPQIQISGVNAGDSVSIYTDSSCTAQVGAGTAGGSTIALTTSPLPDGPHTFYARAVDAAGNIGPCSTANVAYLSDTAPPTPPGTLTNRNIGTSLYFSPFYFWSPSTDSGTGVQGYEVAVGTGPGSTDVMAWINIGQLPGHFFAGLTLADGATYYYSVRAVDIVGNVSSPVTDSWLVDQTPAWVQQAYVKAANVDAGDTFGTSVAIDGDLMVVGAPLEASSQTTITNGAAASADNSFAGAGAAYVYRRTGLVWSPIAYLKAPNADAGDEFGSVVAISRDTIVVGAPFESSNQITITNGATASANNTSTMSGAVYVFRYNGSTWAQEAYIKPPSSGVISNMKFGTSVGVDGDTIIVGAPGENSAGTAPSAIAPSNSGATGAGAAFVFVRTGATWTFQSVLKAANSGASDGFGITVGISGNTAVAGAGAEDSNQTTITNGTTASANNTATDSGAAYVFTRSGSVWTQEAYLKAPNANANDHFGEAIGIFKDTIVVGAWGEAASDTAVMNGTAASADNSATGSGAAYVFSRTGVTWTHQAYLKPSNNTAGASFGGSVAVFGSTIVVGAGIEGACDTTPSYGITASANAACPTAGALYAFQRTGSAWAQAAYLKATNTGASDGLGYYTNSVAISGSTIVGGAYAEDSNQNTITNGLTSSANNTFTDSGAVYVFEP